jgi:hypothetical protein
MKLFSTLLSAAVCGFFALATPVAAQSFAPQSNEIVYSVDSLESTGEPVNIAAETTPTVQSLETVSVPADTARKELVIYEAPTPVAMPVPVSTPADIVQPATPVATPVVTRKVGNINPSVDANVAGVKPVVAPKAAPTSVAVPVPAPISRVTSAPADSRWSNPSLQRKAASSRVDTKVVATQSPSVFAGSKAVAHPEVGTAVQPVIPARAISAFTDTRILTQEEAFASKVAGSKAGVSPTITTVPAAQPVSKTDGTAVADPLVGGQVQVQTAKVGKEAGGKAAGNPVLTTGATEPKAVKPASPAIDTKPKTCDPANLESSIWTRAPDHGPSEYRAATKYSNPCTKTTATLGLNVASTRSVDLEMTQGIGNFEITAKTNLQPALALQMAGIKYSNGQITLEASRDFVEPSTSAKLGIEFPMFKSQKVPDTGLLEMSIHAPDKAPVDGRVAFTYERKVSQTKATLGANFSNTGTAADLEITQGIGSGFEVTGKVGLLPQPQLMAVGGKYSRGPWSVEIKRDIVGNAWEGKVGYTITF